MNEISSDRLTAGDLPDTGEQTEVAEFAHTFDGYRHFGEGYEERLNAIRRRWKADGTLPDDLDDLRACLFLSTVASALSSSTTSSRLGRRRTPRPRGGPREDHSGTPRAGALQAGAC